MAGWGWNESLELNQINFFLTKPHLATINRHIKNYKQVQFYVFRFCGERVAVMWPPPPHPPPPKKNNNVFYSNKICLGTNCMRFIFYFFSSYWIAFRMIWRIRQIQADNTLRDLHNSLDHTQPHSIIAKPVSQSVSKKNEGKVINSLSQANF